MLLVLGPALEFLYVAVDVVDHRIDPWGHFLQLLPEGDHQALAETHLPTVKISDVCVSQLRRHLETQFLLLLCDLVKLIRHQG